MTLPQRLGVADKADGTAQAAAAKGKRELAHVSRLRKRLFAVKGQDVEDKRVTLRHRQGDLIDLGGGWPDTPPAIERMILAPDAAAPQRFQELC